MRSIGPQYTVTGTTTLRTHPDQVFVHSRQSERVDLRERREKRLYSIVQPIIVDLLGDCLDEGIASIPLSKI